MGGGLKQQGFTSSSGGRKSQIKVPKGQFPVRPPLWLMDGHHLPVCLWRQSCLLSLLIRTQPLREGSTLRTSSNPNSLPKAQHPLRAGFQHMNVGVGGWGTHTVSAHGGNSRRLYSATAFQFRSTNSCWQPAGATHSTRPWGKLGCQELPESSLNARTVPRKGPMGKNLEDTGAFVIMCSSLLQQISWDPCSATCVWNNCNENLATNQYIINIW